VTCVLALLCAAAPAAGAPLTASDRAATRALLLAQERLARTLLDNLPSSRNAVASYHATLGQECAGVLAGVPSEQQLFRAPAAGLPTPRARGEHQRAERQVSAIEAEISQGLQAAAYTPDRAAVDTYVAATATLTFSDPGITAVVRKSASSAAEELAFMAPGVCSDLRFWARSGYGSLPPET